MSKQITIGDYLLQRLKELGIKHIFGVPGDYNLQFLDQIIKHPGLKWVGNCNELNAAYAADGYARLRGVGALVTTFGVGELSAINGVAGSYSELIPVIHIAGVPSSRIRDSKALVHHTMGDGRFNVFEDIYKNVTIAQAWLTEQNAPGEIDRVLRESWIKKRPGYIALPSDISYKKVAAPQNKLDLNFPPSNPDAIREVAFRAIDMIQNAKSPIVLIDACAVRFPMKELIVKFLEVTGLPFATMNMAKGIIDEVHAQFIGNYVGALSLESVRKQIEESDCLISFGSLLTDFNTGGFTTKLDVNVAIEIHSYYTRIKQSVYNDVIFCDVIPQLTKQLSGYHYSKKIIQPESPVISKKKISTITQDQFWSLMQETLQKNSTVLAETGTSLFGALQMQLPAGAQFISQTLWGSIGYTVGALLGACMAAPKRSTILFVGDGSFQLTAQEVSTMVRERLTPTIFLLNNDGYTIERAIHGENMKYNDVQMWDYAQFPKVFGKNVWSVRVKTMTELKKALREMKKQKNKLKFIEVIMKKMDFPAVLRRISQSMSDANY